RPPNNTSELSAFRSIQAPAQHPFQRPNVHLSAAGEGVFRASAPSPQAEISRKTQKTRYAPQHLVLYV
ncbi:MAG: hypothetical protein NXH94_10055, partial [Rhodobacteraceae bacterium]|nr:hypothetical protein [Paracoccaceae bacterium]